MNTQTLIRDRSVITDTGCWEWQGRVRSHPTHIYGILYFDRKEKFAHRISYEAHVGPIPDGLELDHLCRNTRCVNPQHLEPVTHRENVRRGLVGATNTRRAEAMTHCRNGHELTPDNVTVWIRPDRTRDTRLCRICSAARERRKRDNAKRRKEARNAADLGLVVEARGLVGGPAPLTALNVNDRSTP